MLLRYATYGEGNVIRPFSAGDIMDTQEPNFSTLTTAGSGTILAATMLSTLNRTGPGGGFTDTFDTAQNIVQAVSGNLSQVSTAGQVFNPSFQSVTFGILYNQPGIPQPGASFRWLYLNSVAFAMTAAAAANSGITLGANVNVPASLVREYLVQFKNSTPQSLVNGTLTNASAVVTGLTLLQTNLISAGQSVFGTNVQALTTVLSVQPGVGITMSLTATATSVSALTITPSITITGLRSATA